MTTVDGDQTRPQAEPQSAAAPSPFPPMPTLALTELSLVSTSSFLATPCIALRKQAA